MAFPPKPPPSQDVQPLQNQPVWPPTPSDQKAPAPQPRSGGAPPATSPTQDTYTHHSSPDPGQVQKQMPIPPPPKKAAHIVTGGPAKKVDVPMHVTKHPNPVGRPKNRNEY
jgi:hypothetical protein